MKTPLDLSPVEIADRLMSVPEYTAEDLGGDRFKNRPDGTNTDKVILVSLEMRDLIVNNLRDWE
jgi:hypothetical protein